MTTLQGFRDHLAAVLESPDYEVIPYFPEQLNPPVIFFAEGDPYIEGIESYDHDEFKVNISLVCVVDEVDNEDAIQSLNVIITKVLEELGEYVVSVGPPITRDNEFPYPAVLINVTNNFTLTD